MNPTPQRDFSTISPSARSLLIMKGHTDIPYARQTAELITLPAFFTPDFNRRDLSFWARVLHFENRYKSIDKLLDDIPAGNILELSSGYSFRGLVRTSEAGCHYIDTDLPHMAEMKKSLAEALLDGQERSNLHFLALNALDEAQFREVVGLFPAEELTIVNEGLLMYLNRAEKEKLCGIIRRVLEERDGCWITSDIYIRDILKKIKIEIEDQSRAFFDQHKIEENKFRSFSEARAFFKEMGFMVEKEAVTDYSKLSSFRYFKQSLKMKDIFRIGKGGRMQATWRLTLKAPSL